MSTVKKVLKEWFLFNRKKVSFGTRSADATKSYRYVDTYFPSNRIVIHFSITWVVQNTPILYHLAIFNGKTLCSSRFSLTKVTMKFSVAVALLVSSSSVGAFQQSTTRSPLSFGNTRLQAVAIDPLTNGIPQPPSNGQKEPSKRVEIDMTGIALSVS
jgi:hypothetical protein